MFRNRSAENFLSLFISLNVLIFIFFLFEQYTSDQHIIGDNGDTRAALYILEDYFLKIQNKDLNLFNINFLFPHKNTIFFSETFFGISPIYFVFRYFDVDIYNSYNLTFFTIFLINFYASFAVFKKFQLSSFSSLFSSTLFTFSLPILAHDSHIALQLRLGCIVAIYFFYKFLKAPSNYNFFFLMVGLFIQFMSSFYIFIFLITFLVIYLAIEKGKKVFKFIKNDFFNKTRLLIFLTIISPIVYLLVNYYITSSLYEFKRGYSPFSQINIFSFFSTNRSILVNDSWIPGRFPLHENQLYLGFSCYLIFIVFFFSKLKINNELKIFFWSTLINLTIFFSIGGVSLYFIMSQLPIFSGIRVTTRAIFVLLFPISLLTGYFLDQIIKKYSKNIILTLFIILIFYLELITAKKTSFPIEAIIESEGKIEQKLIKKQFNKGDVLVVQNNNKPEFFFKELDAMFVSQKFGLKTMNGFTSFMPSYQIPLKNCNQVSKILNSNSMKKFRFNFKNKNLIFIGFKQDCNKVIF